MQALSVQAFANSLEKIYPVRLNLTNERNRIQMHLIEIDDEWRCMGYGTEIMGRIIHYAEMHRLPIELTPSDDFGSKLRRLRKFYKRLGFKKIKGRKLYEMIRYCSTRVTF
ncbi:MAG: GNAT family N-acetyltransferase [Candidatus Kariarchaeaceae archaeon]|jgi:GNAT superfamily N-acetyltransferase